MRAAVFHPPLPCLALPRSVKLTTDAALACPVESDTSEPPTALERLSRSSDREPAGLLAALLPIPAAPLSCSLPLRDCSLVFLQPGQRGPAHARPNTRGHRCAACAPPAAGPVAACVASTHGWLVARRQATTARPRRSQRWRVPHASLLLLLSLPRRPRSSRHHSAATRSGFLPRRGAPATRECGCLPCTRALPAAA